MKELDIVTGWYVHFKAVEDKIRFYRTASGVPTIIVTRGAAGWVVNNSGLFYYHPGYQVKVADTIGSGDSFVAGYLACMSNRQPVEQALQFACGLGAFVATQTGGCPSYKVDHVQDIIARYTSPSPQT